MTTPRVLAAKRWQHRREHWTAPGPVFTPERYAVDVVPEAEAKRFVCLHHYAGTYPAARLAVGLFGPGAQLVGVAVFSVPMNQAVVTKYTGLDPSDGAELGRFVCDPSVLYNGETWLLARAFRLARDEKGIRGVVSYADPLERTTAAGQLCKPAHWGTIYQATNALHLGRSEPRTLLVSPNGSVVSRRALSKIRSQERGHAYATRQLLDAGAPARRAGEDPASWVERVERSPGFRRLRHPGNLVYSFGLTRSVARSMTKRHGGGLSYPKSDRCEMQLVLGV